MNTSNLHSMHHGLGLLDAGQVSCSRRRLTGREAASTLRERTHWMIICGFSSGEDELRWQRNRSWICELHRIENT